MLLKLKKMNRIHIIFLQLSLMLLSISAFSQKYASIVLCDKIQDSKFTEDYLNNSAFYSSELNEKSKKLSFSTDKRVRNKPIIYRLDPKWSETKSLLLKSVVKEPKQNLFLENWPNKSQFSFEEDQPFFNNKRNLYSSIWAYSSLNYIYADLIGLMDKNILSQYQNGVVNEINITPNFLASAAVLMQIPLANVFLPHLIKKENTLRWVQIASGTLMTLIQTSTLFIGKPTPYYAVFSAFEIAATSFITIDAIKWMPKKRTKPYHLLK